MKFSNNCRVFCFKRNCTKVYLTYLCTALNFGQKDYEKLKQISIKVFPTSLLRILSLEGECTQECLQHLASSCVFPSANSGVGIFLSKTDEILTFNFLGFRYLSTS